MRVTQFDDPVEFMRVCGVLLAEREAENGVMLGVVARLIAERTAPEGLFLASIKDE